MRLDKDHPALQSNNIPPTASVGAERLILEHLPEVSFIARQIHRRLPRHVLIEDLVNAGVLGLMDAIQKFDRNKHVQFRSYAKFRIRGAILDSLRELDWGSRALRRQARRVSQAADDLANLLGRTATQPEIAQELGLDLRDLQGLLAQIHGLEVTTVSVGRSFEGRTLDRSEQLPAPQEETPYYDCLRLEMRHLLERILADLPWKEREIIVLYYFVELNMQEIGLRVGVCESRVSQIHSSALGHLRAGFRDLLGGAPSLHRLPMPPARQAPGKTSSA